VIRALGLLKFMNTDDDWRRLEAAKMVRAANREGAPLK
jgi:hypothetical protein